MNTTAHTLPSTRRLPVAILRRSFARRSFAPLALLALAACAGAPTEPPAPAAVVAISTNPLPSVLIGTAIASVPSFEVHSASGRALAGVPVSVAVTAGGGQLVGAPTVSLAGATPIGQWTLGNTSGAQTVTVTVSGIAPLLFTVNANAGPATQFAIVDGDAQYGTQMGSVPSPLRVRARDAFANPVPGLTVTWTIDGGGGSLVGGATTLTDANGIASAPTWTLGAISGGVQAVLATLGAFTARFTATAQLAPASLTVETAAPASATVFTLLAPAPSFAVRDINGTALAGIPVTVALSAGNGQLTSAPALTIAGPTTIGGWRLGTVAGTQSVTVTVAGFAPQIFAVSSLPDVAAQVAQVQGGDQVALAGTTLGVVPRARVIDQYGNGVPGLSVAWAITAGGGSLTGSTNVPTDGTGISTGPSWTIGRRGGAQTLTATAGGIAQEFQAVIQTDYQITLRWVGTAPTGAIALAFQDAVSRITAMIIGDVPNVQIGGGTPFNISSCNAALTGVTPLNELVDDVIIYASVGTIDGPGNTLGSAGPCLTRNVGGLTALGTMRFDSADLDAMAITGRLSDVILHEMLHVVGIGTLWNSRGILADTGTATVRVTGPLATAACANDLGGSAVCVGSVPAENCLNLTQSCGVGTINSHWKESVFRTELMTGYAGNSNPLSRMTIQGLADLGYTVHLLPADTYVVPPQLLMASALMDGTPLLRLPEPLLPRFTVDRAGRIRPILR